MIITDNQLEILHRCIGGGPIATASIVIFGNELGSAETGNLETTIDTFIKTWTEGPKFEFSNGFSSLNISTPPVSSTFLQFIGRMALGLKYKDERFFDTLAGPGKAFLNNYIMNELYRNETCVINLRPLPQSTERTWEYENIKEKEYYKSYNFILRRASSDLWRDIRVKALEEAFNICKNSLILGTGDKHNKKAFLEKIFNITFETIELQNIQIFVSRNPKIILSNYYDNYSGIKLNGLKEIYRFIIQNSLF